MKLTYTLSELDRVAYKILERLEYSTLLFNGEVGAGKTTLIQAIGKALGVEEVISSPTFSLVNEYRTPSKPIFHFDFYRVRSPEEALDIGFEEYVAKDAWIFIEWGVHIAPYIPETYHTITIEATSIDERTLTVH